MRERVPDVIGTLDQDGAISKSFSSRVHQIQTDPMTYGHKPHAKQEEILRSSEKRKIVVAANRVGKTEGGMRDALWCARGNHPYRRTTPISDIWIGSPDYPSYEKFHLPAFNEWCPKSWLIYFHSSHHWADIRRVDGRKCRIWFLSYDMDRTKWQGAAVGKVWLDEEPPEDIVNESLARILTTNGDMMLTFAPIEGPGWWYDRIWMPATRGEGSWKAFTMPMAERDDTKPYGVGKSLVPHISTEAAQEFASQYPDDAERAARVFGEPVSRTGLVYKGYRAEVHKIPRFPVPEHFELFGAVDPGYHGFGMVLGAMDPKGAIYVPQEYFSQERPTKERFENITALLYETRPPKENERPVCVFWVDTEDPQVVLELNILAAAMADASSSGWILVFASLDQGLKARKAGFLRTQQLLVQEEGRETPEYVKRERPEKGEPNLYFFDDLYSEWKAEDGPHKGSRLIWEIEHYAWKKPPPGKTQPDDANEASAHGAHLMAVLRYLVMSRMGAPKEPEQDTLGHLPPEIRHVWRNFEELVAAAVERESGWR